MSAPFELYLVRHGNTFEAGVEPVMIGRNEDLPLTGEGEYQARRVAEELQRRGVCPRAVFCSPLLRTARTAEILCDMLACGVRPTFDPRLLELDYGEWSGLSSRQIEDRFGKDVLIAWNERGIRPSSPFFPAEERVVADLIAIYAEISSQGGQAILISSNGILRSFLKLIPGAWDRFAQDGRLKTRTGAFGVIVSNGKISRVEEWDVRP